MNQEGAHQKSAAVVAAGPRKWAGTCGVGKRAAGARSLPIVFDGDDVGAKLDTLVQGRALVFVHKADKDTIRIRQDGLL